VLFFNVKTEVELAYKTPSFVQNFIQWSKSKKKGNGIAVFL